MIAKLNNGTSVIIEIPVFNRPTLDKLALYNTGITDVTKLMIEELHKGFQPVIYFIEARAPQYSLD
ncbi:hypothetical protein QUA24_04705 [Microcoleus sp. Pol12B5]